MSRRVALYGIFMMALMATVFAHYAEKAEAARDVVVMRQPPKASLARAGAKRARPRRTRST